MKVADNRSLANYTMPCTSPRFFDFHPVGIGSLLGTASLESLVSAMQAEQFMFFFPLPLEDMTAPSELQVSSTDTVVPPWATRRKHESCFDFSVGVVRNGGFHKWGHP